MFYNCFKDVLPSKVTFNMLASTYLSTTERHICVMELFATFPVSGGNASETDRVSLLRVFAKVLHICWILKFIPEN